MAKRVTDADIIKMNELYLVHQNKAEVARQTGFSASTVSKYLKKDFVPQNQLNIVKFSGTIVPIEKIKELIKFPTNAEEWIDFLKFTDEDKAACEELKKEITL